MLNKLSPKVKRFLTLGLGIASIILVVVIFNPKNTKEIHITENHAMRNVLTDVNIREVGVDSLAANLKLAQRRIKVLQDELSKQSKELERVKASVTANNLKTNREISEEIAKLNTLNKNLVKEQIEEIKAKEEHSNNRIKIPPQTQRQTTPAAPSIITKNSNIKNDVRVNPIITTSGNRQIATTFKRVIRSISDEQGGTPQNSSSNLNGGLSFDSDLNNFSNKMLKSNDNDLFRGKNITYEEVLEKGKDLISNRGKVNTRHKANHTQNQNQNTRKLKDNGRLYIPSGSVISGMLITGLDAPTKENAKEEPFPVLISVNADALLPNNVRFNFKECLVIAAGFGDMSSERVYLRTESLSCITKKGKVIETPINAYASGEDGKAGVRGRLVSKQGKLIARSLTAGFLEGLAGAFDVNPVPVINTSSSDTVDYQRVYSSQALQGAAVAGSSKALEKIASFYLKLAQEMFPVLEIDAGRQIDLIVTQGFNVPSTLDDRI